LTRDFESVGLKSGPKLAVPLNLGRQTNLVVPSLVVLRRCEEEI
jgi:hypothetical protein